ncbi:MAG: N-acetyltransferase [Phycisphaerales bacterium]|nr:N-acetyltransferase [Phycisphaerales bacterium]
MRVRPMQEADLASVASINDWYIVHAVANFHTAPLGEGGLRDDWIASRARYPWLVADDGSGSAVTGFAKASPWKGRCAYDWSAETTVYVHHAHQRKGVGRALYEALFEILEARGFRTLLAGITLPNDASVALHEAMGMTPCATFHKVGWKFDAWHDVGYWSRHLGEGPPTPLR